MKTINGNTYFDKVGLKIKQFPYLNSDLDIDYLIIGGGIEGDILNYYLSKDFNVGLVEAERIGRKSTSIATALLEFQLDSFASDLKIYI